MPDIMHLVRIRATPESVYRALTTAEGIRNWWTHDAALDAAIGGTGTFGFRDRRVLTTVRVDALDSPVHVAWTTLASTAPSGWDGSTITFDLRAEDDDTVLAFAHRGLACADEGYARVTTGWGYYLISLQQYLETGTGAPHPEAGMARIVR